MVKVLVVGQNPGYDPDNEFSPRFGTPLAAYTEWFATSKVGSWTGPVLPALHPSFRIARRAEYARLLSVQVAAALSASR